MKSKGRGIVSLTKLSAVIILGSLPSVPSFAIGNWVDLLNSERVCPGRWHWEEIKTEAQVCALHDVEVIDRIKPPELTLGETYESLIGSGSVRVEAKTLAEARERAIELVVNKYIEEGIHKTFTALPQISNSDFLTSDYAYYNLVTTSQPLPPDAILRPRATAKEGWTCYKGNSVYAGNVTLGPPGSVSQPTPITVDQCTTVKIEVDVFGVYKNVTYTLPLKTEKRQVDLNCHEIPIELARVQGLSEPFVAYRDVVQPSYKSILGNSVSQYKNYLICPQGLEEWQISSQAALSTFWLNNQPKPLDINDVDNSATVKYIKALALEKTAVMSPDFLKLAFELHKKYPEIAFGGQETVDNAVETSADDATDAKNRWSQIETSLKGSVSSYEPVAQAFKALATQGSPLTLEGPAFGNDQITVKVWDNSYSIGISSPSRQKGWYYTFYPNGQLYRSFQGSNVTAAPKTSSYDFAVNEAIEVLTWHLDKLPAGTPQDRENHTKILNFVKASAQYYGQAVAN